MNTDRPTPFQIIRTDKLSGIFALYFLGSWILAILTQFMSETFFTADHYNNLIRFLIESIVVIIVLYIRYRIIAKVFDAKTEVSATISKMSSSFIFFTDIGLTYEYMGEKHQSNNSTIKNQITKSLLLGQSVRIVLDPKNPNNAFVKDLFLA